MSIYSRSGFIYLVMCVLICICTLHYYSPKEDTKNNITVFNNLNLTVSNLKPLNYYLTPVLKELRVDLAKLRKNFYISYDNYAHNTKPRYVYDIKGNQFQPMPYFIGAELARRFGVRYIIDLGCGKANKLSKLYPEFIPIGFDYKSNIEYSRRQYSHLTFYELDFESNDCFSSFLNITDKYLTIEIIKNSVLISADVVEHIIDPFKCYFKVINFMIKYATVMVISSPDRDRFYAKVHQKHGPPSNPCHVREWTLSEMEILLIDQGMYPILGGLTCSSFLKCTKGFFPEQNPYQTYAITIGNSETYSSMFSRPVDQDNINILAFVIVQRNTNISIVSYQCSFLQSQGIDILILGFDHILVHFKKPRISVSIVSSFEDILSTIVHYATDPSYQWFMIVDAHEMLVVPRLPYYNGTMSVKNFIYNINTLSQKYNGIEVSSIFIQNEFGEKYTDVPFKVLSEGTWDSGKKVLSSLKPNIKTEWNKMKIWKRQNAHIVLSKAKSKLDDFLVTEVYFPHLKVYPINMIAMRIHPQKNTSFQTTLLNQIKSDMYTYELALSLVTSDRKPLINSNNLY